MWLRRHPFTTYRQQLRVKFFDGLAILAFPLQPSTLFLSLVFGDPSCHLFIERSTRQIRRLDDRDRSITPPMRAGRSCYSRHWYGDESRYTSALAGPF